jgi:hypothetical protein
MAVQQYGDNLIKFISHNKIINGVFQIQNIISGKLTQIIPFSIMYVKVQKYYSNINLKIETIAPFFFLLSL